MPHAVAGPPKQQRGEVGENFLVPAADHADGERSEAPFRETLDHDILVFDPKTEIGLKVMRDFVEEDGLPWLVTVIRNADQRETGCSHQGGD